MNWKMFALVCTMAAAVALAAGRDFRLSPESPAFKLGFVDFDQGDIGPRKTGDESKGSYRTDS